MTNDEARRNDEIRTAIHHSSIRASFVIRHSSFGLRHFLVTSQSSTVAAVMSSGVETSLIVLSLAVRDSSTSLGMTKKVIPSAPASLRRAYSGFPSRIATAVEKHRRSRRSIAYADR